MRAPWKPASDRPAPPASWRSSASVGVRQADSRRYQQIGRPIRPLPLDDDQKAPEGAQHGKGAVSKIHRLGSLVHDDEAERRQRVQRPELDARYQYKAELGHRID